MSVPAETRRTFSKGEAPPALGRRGWGPVVLVGLEPEEASSLAQALGKAGLPVEVASPGSRSLPAASAVLAGFPEALKVAAWEAEADVAALWAVSEEDLARLDAVLPGAPFVLRPIRPREVLMRLRHLGKRRGRATPLRLGPLEIDSGGGWVRVEGREVVLTAKEFALLVALADRAGAFVSRERLMAEVWSLDRPESRTLAVHIRRLRVKLGPAGRAIETRVKQGYRLVPGLLRPAPSSPGLGGGGPPDWAGN